MLNINQETLNAIQSVEKLSQNQFLKKGNVNLPILEAKIITKGQINTSNMRVAEFVLNGEHKLVGEWLDYSRSLTTDEGTYTINHGKFKVISGEYKEETMKTHIECYDEMIKTQKYVKDGDMQITFPSNVKEVAKEVARICDLEYHDLSILEVSDTVERNEWATTEYTYRDVLSHIAGVSGVTIQIKEGKLAFDRGDDVHPVEISARRSKKLTIGEKIGKFNILNITQEPQHDNTPYPEDWWSIPIEDRVEYVVYNNPIADNNRDMYKVKIFNRIKDIEYTTFENDSFGFGIFDVGDKVTVKDDKGVIHQSIITEEIIDFKQQALSMIRSDRISNAQEEYVVATDQRREGITTYLLVDKANGKIESVIEEIGDRTDKSTTVTQDIDGLETIVKSMAVGSNIMPNLNATMEIENGSYPFWKFKQDGLRTKFRTPVRTRRFDSPIFLVEDNNRSINRKAKRFYTKGTATIGNAFIVPDTIYSWRCKRIEGTQPFNVYVIERNEAKEQINRTRFTMTGQNAVETLTFTPTQLTMWVDLEFETSDDTEFIIAEEMFVRGEPVQWSEDNEDLKIWAMAQIKVVDDKITLQAQRVDKLNGDIHNAGLDINAVTGITVWGKNFIIQNESKDKDIFKVVTIDGEEQLYMYGTIQSEGGEIAFDSENKQIKIGRSYIKERPQSVGSDTNVLFIETDYVDFGNAEKEGIFNARVWGESVYTRLKTSVNDVRGFYADQILPRNYGYNIGSQNERYGTIHLQNQPNVSSDKRYKRKISHIDDMLLDEFEYLQRKSFETIHDDKYSFGYIAQDVQRCLYKYIVKVWGYQEANEWMGKFKLLSKSESYLSLLYAEVDIIMAEVQERKIRRLEERDEERRLELSELKEQQDDTQRQLDTLIATLIERGNII